MAIITIAIFASSVIYGQAVKSIARPVGWKDNSTVLLSGNRDMKRISFEYDTKTGKLHEVAAEGKDLEHYKLIKKGDKNPTISPDGKMIALTRNNDLYVIEIASGIEKRYTFDGSSFIKNGYASWVYYEEIFGRLSEYRAFWWSPDSKKLAFYRFDDTNVPMFPIFNFSGQHGSVAETRYPKAGDPNPEVKIAIIDILSGKTIWADFDSKEDQYFGMPVWRPDSEALLIQWMNRDQNDFRLYSFSASSGSKTQIYRENQPTWIEWIEEYKTGKQGLYFVRDFDLWEQIYYVDYNGGTLHKLTNGNFWGTKLLELNEDLCSIYFTSRGETSVRNDVYFLKWKSNFQVESVKKTSVGDFNYTSVVFSPDKRQFAAIISNLKTPSASVVVNSGMLKQIESSIGEDSLFNALPKSDLMFLITSDGFKLPASIIWPLNMDRSKRYPVLFYIYGGPNSSSVMDTWKTPSGNILQLARDGVIQVTVDNRASGHCGKKGINYVFRDLGNYEIQDYILWAKYLKAFPFIDGSRFGITGFSFGGTITALALTEGADYFRFGLAGGGVYDWALYDSHYTERYMDTPQSNPEGYKHSSVTGKASLYRDNDGAILYLTHGTGDDNVHLQNTMQLIDALQKEGKHFELMVYPGGMHGYRGYQNNHANNEELMFWRRTLLDK
ncbi:MAG: DPP IV N-terminal domain-containing protein [Rikenellaceae bacterium]